MGDEASAPEAGPSTIYKSLTRARQCLHDVAYPVYDGTEQQVPLSAVLHPLHGRKTSKGSHERGDGSLPRTAIRQAIANVRSSLHAYHASLRADEELRSSGAATDVAAARTLLSKQQRLASLLREQSAHAIASTDAADRLAMAEDVYRRESHDALRHLPQCMSLCALQERQGDKSSRWPTSDVAQAGEGLKKLVNALETLSISNLGLEAFSEEHPSADTSGNPTYTLAMAARIFVIDLEFALQQDQSDPALWRPILKARVSYATDSAIENGQSPVRDGRLGELILRDAQQLADCVFGLEFGQREQKGHAQAVAKARQTLARFLGNIDILQWLDELSLRYPVPQQPDLFSALESASQALMRAAPQDEHVALCLHEDVPYVSYSILQGVKRSNDEEDGSADTSASKRDLKLRIDLMPWRHTHTHEPSADLPSLVNEGNASAQEILRYTAFLSRPVAMPVSAAQSLVEACGMQSSPGHDDSTEHGHKRCIAGLAALAHGAEQSNGATTNDATKDQAEEAVLVSCFPFASSAQLFAATRIVRSYARVEQVLQGVPLSAVEEVTTDSASLTIKVAIAPDAAVMTQTTASIALDLATELWTVRAVRNAANGDESHLGSDEETRLAGVVNNDGVNSLSHLLASLRSWAQEDGMMTSITSSDQAIAEQDSLQGARRPKRRRSSSAQEPAT